MNELEEIKIEEVNNCYCCFNETSNRSPCKCKAYICKKCLIKYRNFESTCKICQTDLLVNDNTIRECIKINLKDITSFLIVLLGNIIENPVFIALLFILCMVVLGLIVIFIPCLVFNLMFTITTNNEFVITINFGIWITGIMMIFFISLILCCFYNLLNSTWFCMKLELGFIE